MSQPEQSDILVLGSSAAGKHLAWHMTIRKAAGHVPNAFGTIGAHGPAALQDDGVLAASTLSKQDQETVKLLISEVETSLGMPWLPCKSPLPSLYQRGE